VELEQTKTCTACRNSVDSGQSFGCDVWVCSDCVASKYNQSALHLVAKNVWVLRSAPAQAETLLSLFQHEGLRKYISFWIFIASSLVITKLVSREQWDSYE
jgi:hypothetical protein